MRKVKLFGEIGNLFGKEYDLEVNSPAEAIRALSVQIDGFENYLLDSEKNGIGFKVFVKDEEIASTKELNIYSNGEIRIVPIITGSNGEARFLIGAAMIAAGVAMGAFTGGTGTAGAFALANSGIAMALGGTIEILTRGTISSIPYEKADNKPSYSFSGPINTTAQGHPVPVGYGKLIVGGSVISAGISTESLLSGYQDVQVEKYKDAWTYASIFPETIIPKEYFMGDKPPSNYSRRQLITSTFETQNDYDGTWVLAKYLYRYFWYENQLELRTI